VFVEEFILEAGANDVTPSYQVANLQFGRSVVPLLVLVERGQLDSSGDENRLGLFGDLLQGPLDSVENGGQDSWSQLHGQLTAGPQHWVSDRDAGCASYQNLQVSS
jgi:hypothetical protein